ncbi:MAG TPA: hypothetical protein VJ697_14725 [Nitrososphaeraceae archaeon]|nr:hypothetical protein [Nitrososphaeraceae archaeon]
MTVIVITITALTVAGLAIIPTLEVQDVYAPKGKSEPKRLNQ